MPDGDERGETLLTELCAICHANPIKYTCPRCALHTCSLPCVRRHKAWAQCSGVRDPAAYRKRSDLATPAAVDQDFNFITAVERSLQRADDLAAAKGFELTPAGAGRRGGQHGPRSKLTGEIEGQGIRLIRAPPGLSRHKQNKTHWAGQHQCIMWTTEWVSPGDDRGRRFANVSETRTVGEAFVNVFGKKGLRHKRKRVDSQPTRSRDQPTLTKPSQDGELNKNTHDENVREEVHDDEAQDEAQNDDVQKSHGDVPISSEAKKTPPEPTAGETAPGNPHHDLGALLDHLHFYLLRPHTVSKVTCLIPIAPTSRLRDVLQNRTLLEFPTLYVREEAPADLPAPLIAQDRYDALYGTEIPIAIPAPMPSQPTEDRPPTVSLPPLADIDDQVVLEVLQKDLAA